MLYSKSCIFHSIIINVFTPLSLIGILINLQASGSWFIQKVCEVIDESGDHEDLASVLTRAARKISQRKSNTNVPSLDQKMQMPMKQDTLIR